MIPMSGWCTAICFMGCAGSCTAACIACLADPVPFDEVAGAALAKYIGIAGAGVSAFFASVL